MAKPMDEPREFNSDDLESQTKEYVAVKNNIEFYEARQKELRSALFDKIETDGFEDDKGNLWLELPSEIEGYVGLQKQKRVSRKKPNDARAEEIAQDKGLEDRIFKTVRVLDQDELMACLYEGLLTEEEVDEMFPPTVTWALMLSKK
jgi:hypothetical protein